MGLAIGLVLESGVFGGRVMFRVISTDGGWHSYPRYALSQGRDPRENLLSRDELPLGTPGVRSLFHLIAMLPLVQATGVLPTAMLLTCLGISALMPVNGRFSRTGLFTFAMLFAATLAVIIFRKPFLSVLVPSKLPLMFQMSGRHDLPALLVGAAERGVTWKLAHERRRWSRDFLPTCRSGSFCSPDFSSCCGPDGGARPRGSGGSGCPSGGSWVFSL